MSDEIKKMAPADPNRVNIYDERELEDYWVDHFEAPKQSIIDAVLEVGVKADAVYKQIGKTQS